MHRDTPAPLPNFVPKKAKDCLLFNPSMQRTLFFFFRRQNDVRGMEEGGRGTVGAAYRVLAIFNDTMKAGEI